MRSLTTLSPEEITQDKASATAITINQSVSIQPCAVPMAVTISPNSLKLLRLSVARNDVRAWSLNAVSRPKNRADLNNTNGVIAAPIRSVSRVS